MAPARNMTQDEAFAELQELEKNGIILFEGDPTPQSVDLDGWDGQQKLDGCVAGVVVRYLNSGSALVGAPSGGARADRLDARNALALVRLCQWLSEIYGAVELYHLGISGGGVDQNGVPRHDCHGQGRAVDFVGIKTTAEDGSDFTVTVLDDWGSVSTEATPGGRWPDGTGSLVRYRLDDPSADEWTREFFRSLYEFIAGEWQDRSEGPDDAESPSSIGDRSFVMHPDHPATAPGTAHGREAHRNHIHMQIGVTGTA